LYETHLRATEERHLPYTSYDRITRPAVTPAGQVVTRFAYHGGIEGWVDHLSGWLRTESLTVTHPSSNRARRGATTTHDYTTLQRIIKCFTQYLTALLPLITINRLSSIINQSINQSIC